MLFCSCSFNKFSLHFFILSKIRLKKCKNAKSGKKRINLYIITFFLKIYFYYNKMNFVFFRKEVFVLNNAVRRYIKLLTNGILIFLA